MIPNKDMNLLTLIVLDKIRLRIYFLVLSDNHIYIYLYIFLNVLDHRLKHSKFILKNNVV